MINKMKIKPTKILIAYINGIISGFVGGLMVLVFIKFLDANNPLEKLKWIFFGIFAFAVFFIVGLLILVKLQNPNNHLFE